MYKFCGNRGNIFIYFVEIGGIYTIDLNGMDAPRYI